MVSFTVSTPSQRNAMRRSNRWALPCLALDLHEVGLLVRKRNLPLLVESGGNEVLVQPARQLALNPIKEIELTYFSLSTLGSSMTVSVRESAKKQ